MTEPIDYAAAARRVAFCARLNADVDSLVSADLLAAAKLCEREALVQALVRATKRASECDFAGDQCVADVRVALHALIEATP